MVTNCIQATTTKNAYTNKKWYTHFERSSKGKKDTRIGTIPPVFSFISSSPIQFSWIRRLIIQFYFNFQLFQLCFTGYIHAHSKFICHVTIGTPTPPGTLWIEKWVEPSGEPLSAGAAPLRSSQSGQCMLVLFVCAPSAPSSDDVRR